MDDERLILEYREKLKSEGKTGGEIFRLTTGENRKLYLESVRLDRSGVGFEKIVNQKTDAEKIPVGSAEENPVNGSQTADAPLIESSVNTLEGSHGQTAEDEKENPVIESVCGEVVKPDDIYDNDIYFLASEYESTLDSEGKKALYSAQGRAFSGMISYITKHHSFSSARDIKSADTLEKYWDIYTTLVYKYRQVPFITEFCTFLGIVRDTFYGWRNGYRKASCNLSDTCKRIENECRQARLKGASAGNVGMIFLCKAVDGLTETAPVHTVQHVSISSSSDMSGQLGLKCSEYSENNPALPAPN